MATELVLLRFIRLRGRIGGFWRRGLWTSRNCCSSTPKSGREETAANYYRRRSGVYHEKVSLLKSSREWSQCGQVREQTVAGVESSGNAAAVKRRTTDLRHRGLFMCMIAMFMCNPYFYETADDMLRVSPFLSLTVLSNAQHRRLAEII